MASESAAPLVSNWRTRLPISSAEMASMTTKRNGGVVDRATVCHVAVLEINRDVVEHLLDEQLVGRSVCDLVEVLVQAAIHGDRIIAELPFEEFEQTRRFNSRTGIDRALREEEAVTEVRSIVRLL